MDARLLDELSRVTDEERAILEGRALDKSIYTGRSGFTIDRDKMLERGNLIALRPHTRFIDFPRHCHNYIEIMYMCRGSTTHLIDNGQAVVLREGELLFLNRNAFHEIKKAGQDDIAVNFIVLPQFFDAAFEMVGGDNTLSQFLMGSLPAGGGNIGYLHFQVADVPPVQNLVESLIWSLVNRQPNRKNINQITMGLLFLHLLNQTETLRLPEPGDCNNKLVIAVLREIEENYQNASLSAVAAGNNWSVAQLSRLVRRQTGKGFKQILQEKRFSKALQMLLSTRLSVAEIAAYVGYENTSYFHRQFRTVFGLSPAEYRKLHRE